MKKFYFAVIALVALFIGTDVFAQGKWGADSAECIKYMSYYKEYYNQKNYDDAIPNWRQAYKLCPATASQNLLIDGTTLLRRLITKNAANATYKDELVDSLITLHNQRAELYPTYAVTALNNKGLDLANYVKNNPAKLYSEYESIIAANKEQTKTTILLFDLQAAIAQFQDGAIDADKVIEVYQRNGDLLEAAPAKTAADTEQNANVKTDMGSLFASSKVASCENLIELYTPRLAAEPNNAALAASIVKTMSLTDDCVNNELFLQAATVVYNDNPSANAAYSLYKLNSVRGKTDEAMKYMLEAINSAENDAARKAELYYELATFCYKNNDKGQAYSYAQQAVELGDEYDGKAYFLMGNIWASTSCGGDEIQKRAPYWVACDFMAKARNADPSLAEEAGRYISQYSVYFPKTADAFFYEITDGQSYNVACGGLRATTTVRTVK